MTRKNARWVGLLVVLCIVSLASEHAYSAVPATTSRQMCQDVESTVAEALTLLPADFASAKNLIMQCGDAAIPILEVHIVAERTLVIERHMMLAILASSAGSAAEESLIRLLTRGDPELTGEAISFLARRKSRAAIPKLIGFLRDLRIAAYVDVSDPPGRRPVFVRDKAIVALEEITGEHLDPEEDQSQKADAWRAWWRAQERRGNRE